MKVSAMLQASIYVDVLLHMLTKDNLYLFACLNSYIPLLSSMHSI